MAGTVVGVAAIVQPASASTALRGLWHMNESSGTTMVDSSGRGNNGVTSNVKVGARGWRGKAYRFNGVSSIATVPATASLDPGSVNVTWKLRIKFTQLPAGDYDLFRKGTSDTSGTYFKMEVASTGQALCWVVGTAGRAKLVGGPNLADGRWHAITCKKTSTALKLVVDRASYSMPAKVGSLTNSAPVTIGAKAAGDWTNGTLDEASLRIG